MHYYSWTLQLPTVVTDSYSGQKIRKEYVELISTINQLDITDIYKILYSTMLEYRLFSSSHETFTSIAHIPAHTSDQI